MTDLALNEHHESIVLNYMRFCKYQRTQNMKAIEHLFRDVIESRLLEDTYTSDEVQDMFKNLCKAVQGDVESELIESCHSNVLILKQLFKQAEKWHLRLQTDLSHLENKEMLESIRNLEKLDVISTLHERTQHSPSKMKLEPLLEVTGSVSLLNMEIDRLNKENEALKYSLAEEQSKIINLDIQLEHQKKTMSEMENVIQQLQSKSVDSTADTTDLRKVETQLMEVKEQLANDKEQAFTDHKRLQKELGIAKQHIIEVQAQLQLAEQELERKFQDTVAYSNLKQMLAKKNEQIKELRKQLQDAKLVDKEAVED